MEAQPSNSSDNTGGAVFSSVTWAIICGLALLVLWAIPQFTSDQVWRIEDKTFPLNIPIRFIGIWNGLIALAYLGLVPGLSSKSLGAYESGMKLAQFNLFLTVFEAHQFGQFSGADWIIIGSNALLLLSTWSGKTLIKRQRAPKDDNASSTNTRAELAIEKDSEEMRKEKEDAWNTELELRKELGLVTCPYRKNPYVGPKELEKHLRDWHPQRVQR
jgi:type VI protein secretion system component VasK